METIFGVFKTFNFWGWFLLMIGMQYSAGPANILVATAVGKVGFRKSIPILIGLWLPAIIYTLIAGFAFNSINQAYTLVFDFLTLIGTVYIFFIGYSFFEPLQDNKGHGFSIELKDGSYCRPLMASL